MYHISFYAPLLEAEKVKSAMFEAGAGEDGNYAQCSWQTEGKGQFIPINNAKPTIGEIGQTEGYGYASTSKTNREIFKKMINKYLFNKKNLICLFVLLDIRHKPQSIDLEFMQRMGQEEIPFVMVFTKSDKISQTQIRKNIKHYKTEMLKQWEYLPEIFITSSENKNGISEILKFIEKYNKLLG